jgi:DNA repair protein RadC
MSAGEILLIRCQRGEKGCAEPKLSGRELLALILRQKLDFSKISSYLWREFEPIQTMLNLSCLTQEIE